MQAEILLILINKFIGNHVWIASHVDILKGCFVPDGCVLGFKSLVTSKFNDENCIIAGNLLKY